MPLEIKPFEAHIAPRGTAGGSDGLEAKSNMRSLLTGFLCLSFFAAAGAAQAKIAITVDKDAQEMTVAVDGVARYRWPVSTGNPSHETPNGTFRTFRMEEDHYSKEFDDAPMPHSIFFTKVGHAIHGTDSEGRLGSPASHGCVRLSKANATTLYEMVKADGVLNTTVTLTGSSQVALARNPRVRSNTAVARRNVAPAPDAAPSYAAPSYDAAGNPVVLTPRAAQRQFAPLQQQADDGYIYPADGSSNDQRYPAPRSYRRLYDAQATPPQYDRGYAPQPYYQPRGLFGNQD